MRTDVLPSTAADFPRACPHTAKLNRLDRLQKEAPGGLLLSFFWGADLV